MADVKQVVLKSSLSFKEAPKQSSLLQKIHNDQITIKHMSRDSMVAMIHKQRKKTISRSGLNDALLQNIKKSQLMTKSLTDKMALLPELQTIRAKALTSSASSSTVLRSLSLRKAKSTPHGFRYCSDGNVRSSRACPIDLHAEKYEKASQRDITSLKQTLLKAAMIHSRDTNGEYTLSPMLLELLKRESRVMKTATESSENVDIFRFITKDPRQSSHIKSRTDSEEAIQNMTFRDKPIIGRRFLIKENDAFVNSMMQYIQLLERGSSSQRYLANEYEHALDDGYFEVTSRDDIPLQQSDKVSNSKLGLAPKSRNSESPTGPANSSFNIRYGVSSQMLESRKPVLNEYMNKELQKISKTDFEIDEYIREIEDNIAEKAKKRNRQEAKRDLSFDFWKTRKSDTSVLGRDVQEIVQPETN